MGIVNSDRSIWLYCKPSCRVSSSRDLRIFGYDECTPALQFQKVIEKRWDGLFLIELYIWTLTLKCFILWCYALVHLHRKTYIQINSPYLKQKILQVDANVGDVIGLRWYCYLILTFVSLSLGPISLIENPIKSVQSRSAWILKVVPLWRSQLLRVEFPPDLSKSPLQT